MTDPRAALAEALAADEGFPGRPSLLNKRKAAAQAKYLAKRGVLLVTEEGLRRAIHDTAKSDYPGEAEWVAAIFAALSHD